MKHLISVACLFVLFCFGFFWNFSLKIGYAFAML